MIELKVLQAIRLKGRVNPADIAATVGEDPTAVAEAVKAGVDAGMLIESKTIRLSPEGRTRLTELLAAERENTDTAVITAAYDEFRGVNADFKQLVSDWQLKDGEPNAHDDADYDSAVLVRLGDVHARVTPIVAAITAELPRLATYSDKLAAALAKVRAGETTWLTRPIIDSYHTVWFELHEELILAAGLTRESEAQAGHAQ
ncbi:MarR family transcriptional regulator [Mycobacterium vicinigordonae]|uniref:MarR family transcriptional regulator n=1 Tax=Mycobacterium vicinigordonae TaxID=1719132 RepID=A0A7D6I0X1_9MYCO|nr:MarR family transcriptional regulator [Mycobacterium vicinigordonae]QLL09815.1 MarR family transcriptional regulator [Mycobacterium vicinigordonae]